MYQRRTCFKFAAILHLVLICGTSCRQKTDTGADPNVTALGSIEVSAELVEIPGEVRDDPMYDYAHVMKYKVITVHRGTVAEEILYVGQYNPAKSRAEAADARVGDIGGNLKQFRVGDTHRLALEVPIEDYYMGGIINKYFGQVEDPVYWALWTNRVVN
jgi:hypothetical protein